MAADVAAGSVKLGALAPGVLSTANLQGVLDPSQLPAGLVWHNPDFDQLKAELGSLTNAWQSTFQVLTQNTLSLSNQVKTLSGELAALALGSGVGTGAVAVSRVADDTALINQGFVRFHTESARGWEAVSGVNAPSPRVGHTAVFAGNAIWVWGGRVGAGVSFSGSGHRYNPANDVWTEISPVDAPSARMNHVSAASNNSFLIWGGFGASGFLGSGAQYTFATATWSPTTANNAPAARDGHVGVWTGSRFLVWGGRNNSGLLDDGASYDPVANTWTDLPSANAPSARQGAKAVWAGDRWLVWGGEGVGGVLGDGAQLLVDAFGVPTGWAPMSGVQAPTPRNQHAMVRTGERMIVWGGRAGGLFRGDGAAYDPVENEWAPLPTPGSALDPAGRGSHVLAWTGSELLVFGGETVDGQTASGAALELATDLWRALPSTGDPVARSGAIGVWTGTEWLIFGGELNGGLLGAGRRLSPEPTWHFFRKP
jgi:tetrahydromethanopterin S-methyltransferase subunit D